jgi:hypothetical protein
VHALGGVVAVGLAGAGLHVGIGLVLLLIASATARALGGRGLEQLLPRRPGWSVLVRPPVAGTRQIYVTVADRERVDLPIPRIVLGTLVLSMLAPLGGASTVAAAAVGLLGLAALAACRARPPGPAAASPEAEAADALLRFAVAPDDAAVAVIIAAGASVDAHGVASVLDWWAVAPAGVEIVLVGAGDGVARAALSLRRAGWRVSVLLPAELRSLS